MKRIVIISVVIIFFAYSFCLADVCGWSTSVKIPSPGTECSDYTVEDNPYIGILQAGCSVTESIIDSCVIQHKICCPDTARYYEVSSTSRLTQLNVPVGTEFDVERTLCGQAEVNLIGAECASGYSKRTGIDGCASYLKSSPSDYSKSDVTVTAYGRVSCSKFGNTTTVVLNPTASGGGTAVESLVELQKVNTALTTIKTVLDNIPNSTNPLLTDIKTLLQNGLNFNSANLETGINQVAVNTNQVGVNTAAGNEILTAINNKLSNECTGGYVPANCTTAEPCDSGTPGCDCITWSLICKNLKVEDSASLAKLQEIKNAIIAGGTVNADMTETNNKITESNGFLSDIKNFFVGSSTLSQHTDTSASKTAYSSSYFEEGIPTSQSYSNEFNGFVSDMKATPLYGLMGGFFNGVPTSGVSVVSFNGGRYGTHSYDFSSWGSILTVIKALVLIIFAAMSMKIIFLKGGSG